MLIILFCYRVAVNAMKQLHPELVQSIMAKTLYSEKEEKLLSVISSVSTLLIHLFTYFTFDFQFHLAIATYT